MTDSKTNNVVAYNLAGKFVLNGINFLVVSVFVRLLGTENFGLFSLYLTWESILVILVGLQTQSIIGNVSIKFPISERKSFLSSNVCLCAGLSLLGLILMTCFRDALSDFTGLPIAILFFMMLHAFTNYAVNLMTGVWSFDLKAKRQFWVSVLLSLINIGLSLLLILSISEYSEKYIGRIVGSATPTIIFGFCCAIYLIHEGRVFFNKRYLAYTLSFSIPIVFHALSNLVLSQSDRIMLQKMGTLSDVGIYSILFGLNNLIIILMEAFNGAWVPFFYRDMKSGDREVVLEKSRNYIWLFSQIILIVIFVFPELLLFYGGEQCMDRKLALPMLTVGSLFVFFYSFSVNYKYYLGKTKSIAIGTILAGVINILLNIALIPHYGIYGASFSTAFSYMMLWLFHHIGATRLGNDYPYSLVLFVKPLLVVTLTVIVSSVWLIDYIWIRWFFALLIGWYSLRILLKRKSVW